MSRWLARERKICGQLGLVYTRGEGTLLSPFHFSTVFRNQTGKEEKEKEKGETKSFEDRGRQRQGDEEKTQKQNSSQASTHHHGAEDVRYIFTYQSLKGVSFWHIMLHNYGVLPGGDGIRRRSIWI